MLKIRRVVTGHDAAGAAVVSIDEISRNVISKRPGQQGCVIWTSETVPAEVSGDDDPALRELNTSLAEGSVFRIVQYDPGVSPRRHRTQSLDYAVVLSGEIFMELDGIEVHLQAGDALVQRATIHNWVNRGTEPCVIAFVLLGAKTLPGLAAVG
jgi:quercetin dioxygenase-like cupin family protein